MTTIDRVTRFNFGLVNKPTHARRFSSKHATLRDLEILESRQLLTTFTVTNLLASGPGSLRQAIIDANSRAGADTIDFAVDGTIRVGRTSLPAITSPVTIDGSSAPSFAGSPVVTVDYQGTHGLIFSKGADGSVLTSLSLVGASCAGVTLNASHITVQGNYIGVLADGTTVDGNRGDGVRITASSHGDLIGQKDPVSSITYYNANSVSMQPVSGWQGIRDASTAGQYLIAGTSGANGLLYVGPISGANGTSYAVNYPGAYSTSVYGPDIVNASSNVLRLVGSYRATQGGDVQGFVFQGTTADLSNASDYQTIDYPNTTYTYVHSTMGDLAVGNADGPEGNAPLGTGHAFLYSVSQGQFLTDIVYPGSLSTTAYGIWYNGGTSYTIVGGYTMPGHPATPFAAGYMVDYDSATGQFTHWTSLAVPADLLGGQVFATHFEGISSPQAGVYTLAATATQPGSTVPLAAFVATVRRNADGTFGPTYWVKLNYPGAVGFTTNDAVAGNQVVGITGVSTGVIAYQATVNLGFQLSNVISGNGGNGIGIYGADDNQIAMNNIGTNAAGTLKLGNRQNGILVTNGAARNVIGGQASGGNNPTAGVFVRPPQGNLISGNGANGVLITGGATQNVLSGNFVGTDASGNSALGNRQDGVAIQNADNNALIGCTVQEDPFVFYNVLSGNGGNGLRITNSNNTTVHANFMGAGADNATIVANGGDGLLVSGSSKNTQVGGVIPLGNVISGNDRNGIEVKNTASGFVSFNTFAGIFAFAGPAPNKGDGILVTSSGGNNLIRTCIVSGNLGNGIEIGGNATGVQVTETAVGTNSKIQSAIPNGGDGILISGHAHNNAIGGFQPSLEPQVTVSSNDQYGIAIVGSAHDNDVFHTYVGTSALGVQNLGNTLGGIYLGAGTSSNTIGGAFDPLQNKILNSTDGPGVLMQSSSNNVLLQNQIQNNAKGGIVVLGGRKNQIGSAEAPNIIDKNGQDGLYVSGVVTGTQVLGNTISGSTGNGVTLNSAQGVTIGGVAGDGNTIVINQGYGLYATGQSSGSVVQGNTIAGNAAGNVNVTNARGLKYIP
ncbi:MAG: right-handed parallel beta-helix repeat-containing protein [Isosphaeraceae bacterium]|nr:right-handed parallel beta-helix repeat-containing protein [Isosphaeraceae bacterium]